MRTFGGTVAVCFVWLCFLEKYKKTKVQGRNFILFSVWMTNRKTLVLFTLFHFVVSRFVASAAYWVWDGSYNISGTSTSLFVSTDVFVSVVSYKCYLVDPASSHMLVSKIKPCMSKYKHLYTVKLRTAHYISNYLFDGTLLHGYP
jgi:hypothetical protein